MYYKCIEKVIKILKQVVRGLQMCCSVNTLNNGLQWQASELKFRNSKGISDSAVYNLYAQEMLNFN